LKGCTYINCVTMWVVEWGLLDSTKLKHKWSFEQKMKFSPFKNQEWWGVVLWHMYWDQWFVPVAIYSTYYPSCF
jgi:hypothetical protein